jgi:predicted nucleic acid-binding protein
MRERPESVLKRLQKYVEKRDGVVISAITYAELRFGAIGMEYPHMTRWAMSLLLLIQTSLATVFPNGFLI